MFYINYLMMTNAQFAMFMGCLALGSMSKKK